MFKKVTVLVLRSAIVMFTAGSVGLGSTNTTTEDASDNLSQRVRKHLEAQAAIGQSIYLEYTSEDSGMVGVSSLPPQTSKCQVYFEGPRFYHQVSSKRASSPLSLIVERAYDGDLFYLGNKYSGKSGAPQFLGKYDPKDKSEPKRTSLMCDILYLDALGYYAPDRLFEMESFTGLLSLPLYYLSKSTFRKIEETPDGIRISMRVPDRNLVAAQATDLDLRLKELKARNKRPAEVEYILNSFKVLRDQQPERNIVMFLDARYGYAVSRREDRTADGHLLLATETADWKFYEQSQTWLPTVTKILSYAYYGVEEVFSEVPIQTVCFTLGNVDCGRRNVDFILKYNSRGAHIIDRTVPERLTRPRRQIIYTVAADGKTLKAQAETIMAENKMVNRTFLTLLFSGILGGVAIAGYRLFVKR